VPQLQHWQTHDSILSQNKKAIHRLHKLLPTTLQNFLSPSATGNRETKWEKLPCMWMASATSAHLWQKTLDAMFQSTMPVN